MARIRQIKPEFWTSPTVARLSMRGRLLFQSIWTNADDAGVIKESIPAFRVQAFPYDREVQDSDVENDIALMVSLGLLYRTEAFPRNSRGSWQGSQPVTVLVVTNWEEHQKVEKPTRKYTLIQDALSAPSPVTEPSPTIRGEVDDESTTEKEKEKEKERGKEKEKKEHASAVAERNQKFDEFWSVYPRRDDKQRAVKAWDKALKIADADVIIAGAMRYASDPNRDPQYTKQPATWLNAGAWENDPLPARSGGAEKAINNIQIGLERHKNGERFF